MKCIHFLVFFLSAVSVNAQRIQKQIINSTGITYSANGVTLRSSVGEPIVGSFENATGTILSQGFFTGYTKKAIVIDPAQPIPDGFSVYPNPVRDVLVIRGNLVLAKQVQFFDVSGHRLFTQNIDNSGMIFLQGLPTGFYIAKLLGKSDELLNVFKIIKL